MPTTASYPVWLWFQLSAGVLCCVLAGPSTAAAEPRPSSCGRAGKPWVALLFEGESWQPALRASITADLRAGLRLRGIDVCALGTAGSEPPLALVQLGSGSSERVSVSIDVHDAVTEKRVLRDLDLHSVTPDGRALSVAQAAEELLRASWAELALDDAPERARAAPPEVTRAVQPAVSAAAARRDLGVRFVAEAHGGGAELLGADLHFGLWLGARLGCELGVGARQALPVQAPHGSVQASALAGSFALRVGLVRAPRFDVMLLLAAQLLELQLRGRAGASGVGSTASALGVEVSSLLTLRVPLAPALHLRAELGPGLPARAVSATDAGHGVSGTQGLALHGALGMGVMF